MATIGVQLNLERRSTESKDFEAALRRKIVGQDEAVRPNKCAWGMSSQSIVTSAKRP